MNNLIFGTKNKYIFFNILQDIVSTNHTNWSEKLIFYFIKEKFNNIENFW